MKISNCCVLVPAKLVGLSDKPFMKSLIDPDNVTSFPSKIL